MAETKTTPVPIDNELGSTGLRRMMGYITEEYLPELAGRNGLEVYRRMQSDPVVGGLLYGIECLIRQVQWKVHAVDESPAATEAQQFVESLAGDMSHSWSDMMGEVATMLPYGFAPLELVVKQRRGPTETDPRYRSQHTDNRYGVRKLALRAQHTVDEWAFDDQGEMVPLSALMKVQPAAGPERAMRYNGFLAAGLIWGIWLGEAGDPVKIFFLLCVIVAGLYGGYSVSKKIIFVQALPAAVALILLCLAR